MVIELSFINIIAIITEKYNFYTGEYDACVGVWWFVLVIKKKYNIIKNNFCLSILKKNVLINIRYFIKKNYLI